MVKRKTKLTEAQKAQEAAISEIEAIFNMDEMIDAKATDSLPSLAAGNGKLKQKAKKQRIFFEKNSGKADEQNKKSKKEKLSPNKKNIIFVTKNVSSSPYLVDLKEAALNRQAEKTAQEASAEKFRVLKRVSKINFSLPKIKNLRQNSVNSFNSFENLLSGKVIDYFRKHEDVFNQLFFVNILMLLGFVAWRFFRLIYKMVFITTAYLKHLFYGITLPAKNIVMESFNKIANFFVRTLAELNFFYLRLLALIKNFFTKINKTIFQTSDYFSRQASEVSKNTIQQLNNAVKETTDKKDGVIKKIKNFRLPKVSLGFLPPFSWQRRLAFFAVFALMLILPLKAAHYFNIFQSVKGSVLGESEEAIVSLQDALGSGEEFDFFSAADNFSQAAASFGSAQNILNDYSQLISLAKILPSKQAKAAAAGENILRSASQAANAGRHFALAFDSLQLPLLTPGLSVPEKEENLIPLTERLESFSAEAKQALGYLREFAATTKKINVYDVRALPSEQANEIASRLSIIKDKVDLIVKATQDVVDATTMLSIILGHETDARYLVIFQNNAEMRASGGFIGSYALVDFRKGEIKNIEVPEGGSYDLQGGIHQRVAAPQPLHLINSLWEFQDANWWPDWPASANKIQWFFENGWGSSVDGVIAIDPTFVENLLSVIGPIDMSDINGQIVTAENFYEIAQNRDNLKDPNKPKTIIKDLVEKITEVLPQRINFDNFAGIAKVIEDGLAQKHILLNINDSEVQNFIKSNGWDGAIKETTGDYLSVINTNIAGGKTDRKIRQSVAHETEITPDGSIVNTVTIKREHTADKGEAYAGVRNVNYLRVYVPKGSELISAGGFSEPDAIFFDDPALGALADEDIALTEKNTTTDLDSGVKIYNEFNKTVFANWTQVDPGQTINIILKYKLPFKMNSVKQQQSLLKNLFGENNDLSTYSLLVQKQPGSVETDFTGTLSLPPNMEVMWNNDSSEIENNILKIKSDLKTDFYWGLVIRKNQ